MSEETENADLHDSFSEDYHINERQEAEIKLLHGFQSG
jgi:hypothetical protein